MDMNKLTKPLNLRHYIKVSFKSVSPQIILLTIKIALFLFLCSIGFAVIYGFNKNMNDMMKQYVAFSFKDDVTEHDKLTLLSEIRNNPGYEYDFKGNMRSEGAAKLIMFNTFSWVIEVNGESLNVVLDDIDGKLVEGTLPNQEGEVMISSELSKGINKTIGDNVGLGQMLSKRYVITGIYEGELNNYIAYSENTNGYIFKLNEDQINSLYDRLKNNDQIIISTDKDEIEAIIRNLFLLLQVVGIIILIITALEVAVSVSNLNKIYFTERLSEFAILQAVGYSRKFIFKRVFIELGIILVIGLIAGIFLGEIIMVLFYYLYCQVNGLPYQMFNIGLIYLSIFLALSIFVLSYRPVRKYIKNMDWVDVIQESNV